MPSNLKSLRRCYWMIHAPPRNPTRDTSHFGQHIGKRKNALAVVYLSRLPVALLNSMSFIFSFHSRSNYRRFGYSLLLVNFVVISHYPLSLNEKEGQKATSQRIKTIRWTRKVVLWKADNKPHPSITLSTTKHDVLSTTST